MDSQASKRDLHVRLLMLAIMGCCLLLGAGYFVVFTPTGEDVQRAAASAEKLRAVLATEGLPVTPETNSVMFDPSKHRSEIATTASFILRFYDGEMRVTQERSIR
jgi:hypothetical protein